jgi:hypothetical protein
LKYVQEISDLKNERDQLQEIIQSNNSQYEIEVTSLRNETRSLQIQLQQAKKEKISLENEKQSLQSQLEQTENEKISLQNENQSINAKLQQTKNQKIFLQNPSNQTAEIDSNQKHKFNSEVKIILNGSDIHMLIFKSNSCFETPILPLKSPRLYQIRSVSNCQKFLFHFIHQNSDLSLTQTGFTLQESGLIQMESSVLPPISKNSDYLSIFNISDSNHSLVHDIPLPDATFEIIDQIIQFLIHQLREKDVLLQNINRKYYELASSIKH